MGGGAFIRELSHESMEQGDRAFSQCWVWGMRYGEGIVEEFVRRGRRNTQRRRYAADSRG